MLDGKSWQTFVEDGYLSSALRERSRELELQTRLSEWLKELQPLQTGGENGLADKRRPHRLLSRESGWNVIRVVVVPA